MRGESRPKVAALVALIENRLADPETSVVVATALIKQLRELNGGAA